MQSYLRQFCVLLWMASTLLSQANVRFHEHFCQDERVAQQWINVEKTLDCSGISDRNITLSENCSNSNNHAISNKCCSDRVHTISLEECSLDSSEALKTIGEDREYQAADIVLIQLHYSLVNALNLFLCNYEPPPTRANKALLQAVARWNI